MSWTVNSRVPGLVTAVMEAGLLLGPQSGRPADLPQQSCDTSAYALSTPTSRFLDNGDGTVTDTQSKLTWMRCSMGQTWVNGTCKGSAAAMTWAAAQDAVTAVNKGGRFFFSDWRLPQLPELASIAERQCKNPRINLTIFPVTPPEVYWSATSRQAAVEAFAFTLSFGPDGVKYDSKEEHHDVRLVRSAT
jgi:hypothetical protein